MADATYLQFYGLQDFVGQTVTAFICGLDCGDYGVDANGAITVPFGSDPDGLFTLAYIIAYSDVSNPWGPLGTRVDVSYNGSTSNLTIPVVIGWTYISRGQVLRPNPEAESKTTRGSALAKKRRVFQIGLHLNSAVTANFSYGATFGDLITASFLSEDEVAVTSQSLFNGVWWDTIPDSYSFKGMVCWEITRPFPGTVIALTGFTQAVEKEG